MVCVLVYMTGVCFLFVRLFVCSRVECGEVRMWCGVGTVGEHV